MEEEKNNVLETNKKSKKTLVIVTIVILLALVVGVCWYFCTKQNYTKGTVNKIESKGTVNKIESSGCDQYKSYTDNNSDNELLFEFCEKSNGKISVYDIFDYFPIGFNGVTAKVGDDSKKFAAEFAKYIYYFKDSKWQELYLQHVLFAYLNILEQEETVCIPLSKIKDYSYILFGKNISINTDWYADSAGLSDNYFCSNNSGVEYPGVPTAKFMDQNGDKYRIQLKEHNDELNYVDITLKQVGYSYSLKDFNIVDFKLFEHNDELYDACSKKILMSSMETIVDSMDDSNLKIGFNLSENNNNLVTNKDGDNIKKFAITYVDAMMNTGPVPMLYNYVSADGTCFKKEIISNISKQLYGKDNEFDKYLKEDDFVITTNNYYCFIPSGWSGRYGIEEVSNKKSGNTWTFKYKITQPNYDKNDDSDVLKEYQNLILELKDGYWNVKSLEKSNN